MTLQFDPPPYPYLEQVAKHYPSAVWLYMMLWRDRDIEDRVVVARDEIQSTYLMHPQTFKRNLMALAIEGVATIDERKNLIAIELTAWDIE